MPTFINSICQSLTPTQQTENGANGYTTSGKALLDLHFSTSSLRSATEEQILEKFRKAREEQPTLALLWLFYARDVRHGLGERRLFRTVLQDLAKQTPTVLLPLVKYIPEYGRWDDLLSLLDEFLRPDPENELEIAVLTLIRNQLNEDMANAMSDKPISLLAKWMPSEHSRTPHRRAWAEKIRLFLGVSPKQYRKIMSKLRTRIGVIEQQMSAGKWEEIDYPAVSSGANLLYRNAFLNHDPERRTTYMDSLKEGETKIHAGTLSPPPHDIVHRYYGNGRCFPTEDATLEELWSSLPDTVNGSSNTLVVADGSGNMTIRTGTIPMQQNQNGVVLLSGFSPNLVRMVMSGKTDPYEYLLDEILSKRYEPILEALKMAPLKFQNGRITYALDDNQ